MDVFLGEIRIFPFATIPSGWHLCDGTLLNITSNAALYSLFGTAFGGNGSTTFALPDLRGRAAIGVGGIPGTTSTYLLGNKGGVETVALTTVQAPMHNHYFLVKNTPGTLNISVDPDPVLANPANISPYNTSATTTTLHPTTLTTAGAGGAHTNMQPFLVQNFCICTSGLYPPRN